MTNSEPQFAIRLCVPGSDVKALAARRKALAYSIK